MKRKRYTPDEREQIEERYLEKFGNLPPTPICFSISSILDLMEMAIDRGEPLKWEEYEKWFHYKKGVTY